MGVNVMEKPKIMQMISSEQFDRYQASAKNRQVQRQQRHLERQQQGWQVARQAAEVLKQLGATQVKLFGSMLELRRIHAESDVDLAVEGLSDDLYLEAVARLLDLSALSVDLVQMEHAMPKIQEAINQYGVEL